MQEGKNLKQLGSNKTVYNLSKPDKNILEVFENVYNNTEYNVQLIFPEFTSLCPKTGQPDFAKIIVDYIPDKKCIESKSFKMYLFSYRNTGAFMETITNKILNHLFVVCEPKYMKVQGIFNARGGTFINVTAEKHQI